MFRFDVFEFDASARELRRQGRRLKLSGQPVEVLAVFLENADRVVSREELRKRLWPENTFVDFDHSLNTAINKLREVLGDSASEPRFIETLPRRGYRFIASVESVALATPPASTLAGAPLAAEAPRSQASAKLKPPWVWMVASLAMVGAVLGLRFAERGPAFVEPRRIISRPLTSNPQELRLTAAAVSPDGVYLAFTDVSGLYLRRVETSETHPLPLPDAGRVVRLSWFPDGTRRGHRDGQQRVAGGTLLNYFNSSQYRPK